MHASTITFFLLTLITLCLSAPTPIPFSTNPLSATANGEMVKPRSFTNGFGLLSNIDARHIHPGDEATTDEPELVVRRSVEGADKSGESSGPETVILRSVEDADKSGETTEPETVILRSVEGDVEARDATDEKQDCGAPFCSAGTAMSAPTISAAIMAAVAMGGLVLV